MMRSKILILGKLPPPYMGPAIATQIILNSSLKDKFNLLHLDTGANTSLQTIGKWSIGKLFRNITIYFRLINILIKDRPQLVLIPISQSTLGYWKDFFFIAISRIAGRKVIVQLRGSNFKNWLAGTNPFMSAFVRWSLGICQAVIVLGNNLKPLFYGIFEQNQIFVVPNGGNYDLSFSVKQHDLVRILYLGNLQSSKGIEDVVDAIALLAKKDLRKFHLDVVGNWRAESTRLKVLDIIEKNNLPVSIHPPSGGSDKIKFLTDADIFVFTPRAPEGHPWVIVEAMAAGLPIISTDKGAIIESVHDGANGFIIESENPAGIAEKLELLISDKAKREEMGKMSRTLYEQHFTEEQMVQNLAKTFEIVLNQER